jgi:murein L,D-transpeptidase YcbB/YkuD
LAAFALGCGDSSPSSSTADANVTPAVQARQTQTVPSTPQETTQAATSAQTMDSALDRLQQARERYRRIADAGGWPSIPAGDLVRPGDTAQAQVQALRDRLAATDELAGAAPTGAQFDTRLASALAAFQHRHGLVVDSLLGGNTRTALNVPASRRVAQIDQTIERWDALPEFPTGPGERYVMVNVPEFRVRGFEGGEEAIQMEVVVGETYDGRATPLFHDTMEHVIFRPYWNVPPSIAREELVPDGPRSLSDRGFEIVSHYAVDATVYDMTAANLDRVASGNLRLRQTAGSDNALGLVKFMFPNQYAVYLHDTPADHLFDEADRAFSHGCIRLERPADFGAWVLGPQGWDEARVRQAMNEGGRERVELEQNIPVYIVYLTVYADENGDVYFLEDIYDEYAEA